MLHFWFLRNVFLLLDLWPLLLVPLLGAIVFAESPSCEDAPDASLATCTATSRASEGSDRLTFPGAGQQRKPGGACSETFGAVAYDVLDHAIITPLQESQVWGVRIANFSLHDFVNTLPEEDDQRQRKMAMLGHAMKTRMCTHRFVVFSDQGDLTPAEHTSVVSTLGPLEDRFNKYHSENRNQTADPWSALPRPVWPISNNPALGTKGAGDGGFHVDGHWFGSHWRYTSFFVRQAVLGGNTWFISSPDFLAAHPEVKEWGKRLFIKYNDKIVYPNGNTLAPSNSSHLCPLVTHLDGEWTMACFLDPKYYTSAWEWPQNESNADIDGSRLTPIDKGEVEEFEASLASKAFEMRWKSGDLSFLDNWKLLHKATPGTQRQFYEAGEADMEDNEKLTPNTRLVHRITTHPEGGPGAYPDVGCLM